MAQAHPISRLGDWEGYEVSALDEFAIHKGHRYATVVVEPTRKRVLWIGRGRGRKDVRPFFKLPGVERCARLRAAVMDMNAIYELEVRQHCPNAAVVYVLRDALRPATAALPRGGSGFLDTGIGGLRAGHRRDRRNEVHEEAQT